jgi:putative addiction module killer protein
MIINELSIREYVTPEGFNPFRDWLSAQHPQVVAQVHARLLRAEMGNLGDTRPVGHGVQEFRFHSGPGIRVYFGRRGKLLVLLLCGGDKRSQRRDIIQARRYWLAYQERRSNGT